MKLHKEFYKKYSKEHAPKSKVISNAIRAFIVGGLVCVIGQLIKEVLGEWIKDADALSSWVSICLIFLSCFFSALGVYDHLAKYAGAGTLVPITGFANATISPALDAKSEGWVLGIGAKIFTVAGPVILYGTVASVMYGVIYWVTTRI